jgi:RimJ/RimL family protein N-acetyltransferase
LAGPTGTHSAVRLEQWGKGDLSLLEKLLGDPEMTRHLGGPESPEQLAARQKRYEQAADSDQARVFKVVDDATGEGVGWVGYWEREWREQQVFEIGWAVLPEFQGRGIAGHATALAIDDAKEAGRHRYLHAFPSVDNAPSNAICQKLGFTLLEALEFEYPKGHFMLCNDWRLALRPEG